MPQTTSWNIGVGVSCFIGAIGGMYLAYQGYKHIRKVKELHHNQNKNEFCPICNTKIDSVVDTNWISCINCAQIVCRKPKCSKWIASRGQSEWECQLCHDQRRAHFKASEWLLTQLSKKLQISNALDLDDISVIDYDNQLVELNKSDVNGTISVSQKEYIRAFLEDLLGTLLGGSLDNVLVGPIRKNSDYIGFFTKYHKILSEYLLNLEQSLYKSIEDLPICDHECPGLAQANLKRLIQKIIAEAARLPELLNRSGVPPRPEEHLPYFDPKKYNQLLATAVLNKVVDSYHNPRNQVLTKDELLTPNVDINQNTVKPEKDTPKENEIALKPSETPITSAMKIETQSALLSPAAVSSATSQSVYSDDDSESSEQLLETLIKQQKTTKQQLPDLTSDETNDDEYHSIKSVATDSTWEDNWMFKSKKNTNDGSNSIAMLIPSPTEDVKVLIGDRTADEISDLSDNHDSDNDDEYSNSSDSLSDSDDPPKSPADIPNVLVHNKTVIGGKHPLTDFIENSNDFESLTSHSSFSEAKNDLLIDDGDFVKVDKPLLDIEYSTLDMKNGNVEKMKEAINPYVERKVNTDSDVIGKKSGASAKVEKNIVSGVSSETQKPNEIIADTPIPAPRKSSKGDLPAPNSTSPKPDDSFGNIYHNKIKIHPTTIHKRKPIVTYSPDEDYSIDLLPIIDIGTQIDDHETILHAIYISSPPPLLLLPTLSHHDVVATKIINISDHDDDDDYDGDDDDDVDVDDSDFDLISVNSSEFSFYKPRNLNSRSENSSVASPIEKSKISFNATNEEICKEILEMIARQPQDIVVSTVPAIKEETKITISQTVWQPQMIPIQDNVNSISENILSTADDENLVEDISDIGESMDESNKSVSSIDEVVSPVESEENFLSLKSINEAEPNVQHSQTEKQLPTRKEIVATMEIPLLQNPDDSLEHSTVQIIETEPKTDTDLKDQLTETLNNTISEYVVVKEYVPEETVIVEDNNQVVNNEVVAIPETDASQISIDKHLETKEFIPANELVVDENTHEDTNQIVATPATIDVKEGFVNVIEEVRKIEHQIQTTNVKENESQIPATQEIGNMAKPQTDLIQELEGISLTTKSVTEDGIKVDENIEKTVFESIQPATEKSILMEMPSALDFPTQTQDLKALELEFVLNQPVLVSEEKTQLEEKFEEQKSKFPEPKAIMIAAEIPIIKIESDEQVSMILTKEVRNPEVKLEEVTVMEISAAEVDTDPAIEIHIQTTDLKEHVDTSKQPISTNLMEEDRKIEDNTIFIEEIKKVEVKNIPTIEITPNTPVSKSVPEIVQMLGEKLGDITTVGSLSVQFPIKPTFEMQNLTNNLKEPLADASPNEQVSEIVTKEIKNIEEKLEELESAILESKVVNGENVQDPIVEVQIPTIEIIPNEPVKNILSEIIPNPIEGSVNPVVEIQIQTTDLKVNLEPKEPFSIILTPEVIQIEEKLEEMNPETRAVEIQKLDEDVVEPKSDFGVNPNEPTPVIATEEIQKVVVFTQAIPIEETVDNQNLIKEIEEPEIDHALEPQIQITNLKEETKDIVEAIPNISVIVNFPNEVSTMETKFENAKVANSEEPAVEITEPIKVSIPGSPRTKNLVQHLEELKPIEVTTPIQKQDESVINFQIQTMDLKEIEQSAPVAIIVSEEVRKIEEKLEEINGEIRQQVGTSDFKEVDVDLPNEQMSVIVTEETRPMETKVEEIKVETQEITITANTSQIIEEKLEQYVIEPQIQITHIKEIETKEPEAIIATEKIRKIEEKPEDVQNESIITEPVEIALKSETNFKEVEEITPSEEISVATIEEVLKNESKVEEVKVEILELTATVNTSQIIEDKLEESVIECQIQTTEGIKTNQPVSVIVTEEIRKIEEKLPEVQNENVVSVPVEIDLKIQTTNFKDLEKVTLNDGISVVIPEEAGKIEPKVEETKLNIHQITVTLNKIQINEEKLEQPVIQPQIQTTDITETETPVSVMVTAELQNIEEIQTENSEPEPAILIALDEPQKAEEVKTEIDEVTVNASEIINENLKESIIAPQIGTTNLTEVPGNELQLPKIKATLETVPQIKLVEFQDFPISVLPSQSTINQSTEPLQLTIISETTPKQPSPTDANFEINTESEIKTIPIEIGSIMKSSKLVAGLTTKKVTTVSLTLEPATTLIEKTSPPPKSEAVEVNSLELNLQTIEQKQPESRYSSPLFKPLLPKSPPPPVVKLTIVDSPKEITNNTNTSTSSIIVDTTATPITKPIEEDEVISVEVPFPGSIAEREHNKWQNAAPIANNPYSVEVLERRLSQKSHDSLTFKNIEPLHTTENGKPMIQDKHLVDVFKAEVSSHKRFGRDYYINEAKKASGERLRRSELLNRQLHNDSTSSDDHVSDSEYQNFLYVRAATEQFVENEKQSTEHPLQKSKSSGDTNHILNENIFAARPIMVEEDDPILERAHRIEALSTDDRDFFLLPIEEAQMNIGFSSSEASSLRSPSSLSEDSDTARIYNLRSQEIKKVKEPEPKYSTPVLKPKIPPKSPTVLKAAPPFLPITPPPPVKLSANTKIMSKSVPMIDKSDEFGQTNKHELADDINNNVAIEEEIKHVLPSVKNLAKAFTETKDKPAPGPINKPKTPWHSTSNLSKPIDNGVVPPKPQPVKIAEPFIRPGYSISGRSISKQFKDELREITPKSVDSNNNLNSTVNSNTKVVIPPRTPSPTPVPGALRNTLAFFENLNNKH